MRNDTEMRIRMVLCAALMDAVEMFQGTLRSLFDQAERSIKAG